jgi:phosphotransferase system enzyme I (PtsP)
MLASTDPTPSVRRRAAGLLKAAAAAAGATNAKIHVPGQARLDRVLDFVSFVASPLPLSELLDEAPKMIADIIGADVALLFLLEGDRDALVLRGSIGFPLGIRGTIRLGVGEGLTGMAVEMRRPVSVVGAPQHERYVTFPELHEERFPVFLAVPILGHSRPLGALVMQRAGNKAFRSSDVNLAVALTAPIAASIRHAQLLDDLRKKTTNRRTGGGTRKVTLPGVPVVSGMALGAIAALRRPATTPRVRREQEDPRLLRTAFEVAEKAVASLLSRAQRLGLGAGASFLSTYLLMASDERLRQRAFELIGEGRGVAEALGMVAREAVRAANGIVGDRFMQERARDIEDLCDAVVMLASPDAQAELPSKAVLIADELTVFDLLVSSRAQPVGIALTERAQGPRKNVLLRLMGVPSITDVGGVFRWAAPGDVALLDADHGFLVINPSRAEVASVRAKRREKPAPPSPSPDGSSSPGALDPFESQADDPILDEFAS